MSQEPEKKPQLTINDPVSPDELKKLAELQGHRLELGDALLELEQEKVKILVQARQVDDQKTQLFGKIVTERGLPAGFPVEIDAKSGIVKPIVSPTPNGQAPQAAPPPAPAPVS